MVKIILASHGELSKGMLNSVSMIVGKLSKGIETYSLYPGENPNDYALELTKKIQESKEHFIIICDIKGGSVYNALLQTCSNDNVDIISGMNMNMILEIVLANSSGELNLEKIIDNAKAGIILQNSSLINNNIEEEEF